MLDSPSGPPPLGTLFLPHMGCSHSRRLSVTRRYRSRHSGHTLLLGNNARNKITNPSIRPVIVTASPPPCTARNGRRRSDKVKFIVLSRTRKYDQASANTSTPYSQIKFSHRCLALPVSLVFRLHPPSIPSPSKHMYRDRLFSQIVEPCSQIVVYRVACIAAAAAALSPNSLRDAAFGLRRVSDRGRCLSKLKHIVRS